MNIFNLSILFILLQFLLPGECEQLEIFNFNNVSHNPVVVNTENGFLRGFLMHTSNSRGIQAFQGIPYGEPPIGHLRFREPQAAKPWNGTRDAIALPPICIQVNGIKNNAIEGAEDCLYLNVYRPEEWTNAGNKRLLPVIFWLHGGGFRFGAGSIYGPAYLLDHDVILVTVNFRLAIFGYFSTGDDASPGNQGLKDAAMALLWVRDNIQFFGGDPGAITVIGESTGGVSASLMAISPLTKNLFQRGISQSGTALSTWGVSTRTSADLATKAVAQNFNCIKNSSIEIVNCLREVDANVLVKFGGGAAFLHTSIFLPVVEHHHPGAFLSETPQQAYKNGRVANIPWIFGVTGTELARYTSMAFLNPVSVDFINSNWTTIGVSLLGFGGGYSSQNSEIAEKLWEFYMGDLSLNWDSRFHFSGMWSDADMFLPMVDAIRYHSTYTSAKTFGYQMTHQGSRSIQTLLGYKPSDWGPVHLDDLIYLFNNTEYFGETLTPEDPEFQMVKVMTQYFANFVTTGNPNGKPQNGPSLQSLWLGTDKNGMHSRLLPILNLKPRSEMMVNPFAESYEFWQGLNLTGEGAISSSDRFNPYIHHSCHNHPKGDSEFDNLMCSMLLH